MARIVIAPDSFKGSLDAASAAAAIAAGWRAARPDDELITMPQADGGEGTLEAVASASPGARYVDVGPVTGPDGRSVHGRWLMLPDGTAVVELAQPSGLSLMDRLDPLGATTRGLGQVILDALDSGASALVIGLGGSASTDGAAGALSALGLRFLDEHGAPLRDGGGSLRELNRLEWAGLRRPPADGVRLLSDVTSPLLGPYGAAAVFAPQKGASADEVAALEANLEHYSRLLGGAPTEAGAGAAGGTAYGFATAWHASIEPGSAVIAELTGLNAAIRHADLLVTGEGRFDATSRHGKVVGNALSLAKDAGVHSAVIAGAIDSDPGCWSAALVDIAGTREAALNDPVRWLRMAGAHAAQSVNPESPALR